MRQVLYNGSVFFCRFCGMFGGSLESPVVVDWLFLPQNFGPVVGTYKGLLRLCECTLGGGSIFRWWGHLTTICTNRTFSCCRWWGPCHLIVSPVLPLSHPLSCSLSCLLSHSLSRPLSCSLSCSLSHPLSLPHLAGGGDPKT